MNILNFRRAPDINGDSFAHISFLTTTEEGNQGSEKTNCPFSEFAYGVNRIWLSEVLSKIALIAITLLFFSGLPTPEIYWQSRIGFS